MARCVPDQTRRRRLTGTIHTKLDAIHGERLREKNPSLDYIHVHVYIALGVLVEPNWVTEPFGRTWQPTPLYPPTFFHGEQTSVESMSQLSTTWEQSVLSRWYLHKWQRDMLPSQGMLVVVTTYSHTPPPPPHPSSRGLRYIKLFETSLGLGTGMSWQENHAERVGPRLGDARHGAEGRQHYAGTLHHPLRIY